ncbi:MAG: hypothetical protein ACRCT6_09635, partial [Notoacmeibacter sp.]
MSTKAVDTLLDHDSLQAQLTVLAARYGDSLKENEGRKALIDLFKSTLKSGFLQAQDNLNADGKGLKCAER